jgi:hypothetical protein
MEKVFAHYYKPTSEGFDALWKDCTFSFDANVLLDVYRYSPETRDRLIDVLKHLNDRIWIPYQVGAFIGTGIAIKSLSAHSVTKAGATGLSLEYGHRFRRGLEALPN